MIQRFIPVDELRAQLAQTLTPPGQAFWAQRVSIEEDLMTWWAAMLPMLLLFGDRQQPAIMPLIAHHFRSVGQVLRRAGATSGAELVDPPRAIARRIRHGAWRYER